MRIFKRPDIRVMNALFENKYGQHGLNVYTNFIKKSHTIIRDGHGGAPWSSYLSEYFIRCALNNKGSNQFLDYEHLSHHWQAANEANNETYTLPSKKNLDQIIESEISSLILGPDNSTDTPTPRIAA